MWHSGRAARSGGSSPASILCGEQRQQPLHAYTQCLYRQGNPDDRSHRQCSTNGAAETLHPCNKRSSQSWKSTINPDDTTFEHFKPWLPPNLVKNACRFYQCGIRPQDGTLTSLATIALPAGCCLRSRSACFRRGHHCISLRHSPIRSRHPQAAFAALQIHSCIPRPALSCNCKVRQLGAPRALASRGRKINKQTAKIEGKGRNLANEPAENFCMPSRMVARRPQDGALFTWGDGASGALGYEHPSRQYIPRQVGGALFLEAVTQVRRPSLTLISKL